MAPGQIERTVFEVRREHFFTRLEPDRPRRDVHAGCGVRDEDEVVRIGADVRSEPGACLVQELLEPTREEQHRLSLELELPSLVPLEHRTGTRAEGPVIQKRHTSVEQELVAQAGAVRHPSYGSRACLRAPGRSVRARTGSRASSSMSSASARSRQACSSGAATATPRKLAYFWRESSRCTIPS